MRLGPQCCGDLADITSWFRLASPDFSEGYLAPGGHPNPRVRRDGSWLRFTCVDPDDPFGPGTVSEFAVQREAFVAALPYVREQVVRFENTLAGLHASGQSTVGPHALLGLASSSL